MSKLLIFGNQKTYLDNGQLLNFLSLTKEYLKKENVVIFPTSVYLKTYQDLNIKVGLQNVSHKNDNNQTGEITPIQGKSLGIKYALVGHSERRAMGESDLLINQKIKALINEGITAVLCVGETLEEKNKGLTNNRLIEQLTNNLQGVKEELIIAYEPLWSIGSGIIPTIEDIKKAIDLIKMIVHNITGKIPLVLYGGSVSSENILELATSGCNGFLIGGASTKSDLIKIIERIN